MHARTWWKNTTGCRKPSEAAKFRAELAALESKNSQIARK
jgi:hypothetical protein